jgi:branched-chain amino acid transport system substrate-binding protein
MPYSPHAMTARRLPLALLALAACALAACGGDGARKAPSWTYDPAAQPTAQDTPGALDAQDFSVPAHAPVRVALLLPLTGERAALGRAIRNAAQMALFDARDAAVTLAPYDTGGTADGAERAARDAVSGGADIILGPLLADAVRGAAGPARDAGVPVVALSTDWTLAGRGVFVAGFTPFDQVERVARAAAARGLDRVAVLLPHGRYGDDVGRAWDAAARRHGLETVARGALPPEGAAPGDLARAVGDFAARAQGADAVFMPVAGAQGRTAANILSASGLPPSRAVRLGTGVWDERAMAFERALDGGLFAAPDPAARAGFEARYTALHGARPPRLATLGYDAMALAAVLGRSGPEGYAPARIADPSGFAGIDGIFRFTREGVAERGLALLRFAYGRAVVDDPAPASFVAVAAEAR